VTRQDRSVFKAGDALPSDFDSRAFALHKFFDVLDVLYLKNDSPLPAAGKPVLEPPVGGLPLGARPRIASSASRADILPRKISGGR
jgi:hypothetical protein